MLVRASAGDRIKENCLMPAASNRRVPRVFWLVALAVVTVAASSAWPSPAAAKAPPQVTRPPSVGAPKPQLGKLMPESYVEEEFFVSGLATAYKALGTWGSDGKWVKVPAKTGQPYKTRILVERPKDPAKFNGTVWVEWMNTTLGSDQADDFYYAHNQMAASGAIYVGVSAQKGGVDNLVDSDEERYGSLSVGEDDALSYDIFSQVGRAVRSNPEVLGGLKPEKLYANGGSQSAMRLVTYANAWQNTDKVFDGILPHSRLTFATAGDGGLIGPLNAKIRTDISVPVFMLESESDVGPGYLTGIVDDDWAKVRQPNQGNVHTWEVAGASHGDHYLLATATGITFIDADQLGEILGCGGPVSTFPFRYAANAGFAAFDRWVRTGERIPSAPPIEMDGIVPARDENGNAKGGVRLPDLDVPVAQYTGGPLLPESGNVFCGLLGRTFPFSAEKLQELYPTHDDYVAKYTAKADAALAAGFMTQFDHDSAIAAAEAAPVPS
jgi:hypothetical protein